MSDFTIDQLQEFYKKCRNMQADVVSYSLNLHDLIMLVRTATLNNGAIEMTDTFVRNYSPLNDDQKRDMDWVKHKAEELLTAIETPSYADPRMKAVAKTQLEIAVMCAVKAITNPPVKAE